MNDKIDNDDELKIACRSNNIEKVKEIIRMSSKNGTFRKLQLFDEMQRADEKGYTELTHLLRKYSGIQWNMILEY
jgi:hypothetical protein